MGFFAAINSVFAKFFTFSGRATRPEFWWFFLFEIVAILALGAVDTALVTKTMQQHGGDPNALLTLSPFDFMLLYYGLITFIPRLSLTIRRLHDVGLSGFLYLLYFVPFVGALIVFVLTLMPSEQDDNMHGPFNRPSGRGGPRTPGAGPGKRDPMQGYAVLFELDKKPTPQMQAARKAEVRALYEQRVLGKGPIVAE